MPTEIMAQGFVTDRAALEAEAAGNTPAAAATGPDDRLPPGKSPAMLAAERAQAEKKLQEGEHKSPADLAREAITAKFAAARSTRQDESVEAMREGVNQFLPEAQTPPLAPPAATTQPSGATPAPTSTDHPLANRGEVVTIHVDGREYTVPAEEVLRHGVATLQKQTAADLRLQRVTEAEQQFLRQAAAERAALEARRLEIESLRATTPQRGAAQATDAGNLPSGEPPSDGAMQQALEALLDSDVKGAAKSLDRIITEQVESRLSKRMQAQPAPAQPAPAPTVHPQSPNDPWSQAERDDANNAVFEAFGELTRNPTFQAGFVQRIQNEMASPVNRAAHVNLNHLALRIAREVAFSGQPSAPAPAQPQPNLSAANPIADEIAARRSLAARVPGLPAPSQVRAVTPAPSGPAPLTRSQVVQQMRKARGFE